MPDIFVNHHIKQEKKEIQPITPPKLPPLSHVFFAAQDADESILMLTRRHPITNVSWVITLLLLTILPIALNIFFPNWLSTFLTFLPQRYIIIFNFFYYALLVTYGFVSFLDWFYNILIVTNKSLVLIQFSDLVYHKIIEARLESIQHVTYSQTGPLSSFFDFGNLTIQTESREEHLQLNNIPHPQETADKIHDLSEGRHES